MSNELVLGIDTSNYKTSVAVVSRNRVLFDKRTFLTVKEGERGLRQSEALYQHVRNFPDIFSEAGNDFCKNLCAVAYSGKPRSVEDSYMPCFLAGKSFAESIGSLLGIPAFEFSHQDGHVEAVRHFSDIGTHSDFLACHFSGGTCEILKVQPMAEIGSSAFDIEIIGGSRDISFGQVLDRAGVKMGMLFPCGAEMDDIAINSDTSSDILSAVKVKNGWINLSGIETQIMRSFNNADRNMLIREIFDRLEDAIYEMIIYSSEMTGIKDIIMSGGVSSSEYLRRKMRKRTGKLKIHFDNNNLSSDNAVGTAFLGGRMIWG